MGKWSTPRVPIQTPMFDGKGLLTRTWVIFFERLGRLQERVEEVVDVLDCEKATFVLNDTAVGENVTNLLPVRRSGIAVDAEIVPKEDVTADFEFDILLTRLGDPFDARKSIFDVEKLLVPAGTKAGKIITQTAFLEDPYEIHIDDVLSGDILQSDGTNTFTVVLKWRVE